MCVCGSSNLLRGSQQRAFNGLSIQGQGVRDAENNCYFFMNFEAPLLFMAKPTEDNLLVITPNII